MYIYRRVPPKLVGDDGKLLPGAFDPLPHESLSVFHTGMRMPYGVLHNALEDQRAKLSSGDKKKIKSAKSFFLKNGSNVQEMVTHGWLVVRLPATAFTTRGLKLFQLDRKGHLNIKGTHARFMQNLINFAEEAEVVPKKECLKMQGLCRVKRYHQNTAHFRSK